MKTMMKSMILGVTAAAILGAGTPSANAHDRGWATAGKILTGVVAGTVLARALEPSPCYPYATTIYAAPTVVYPTPVVMQPPRTVVYQTPVVAQPSPTVVYQTPTVVYQNPVVVQPAPMVVYQTPMVVRPMPIIGFRVGFGGHYPYRTFRYGHGW